MKTQRKHGFTIVELVIVIAVIAILAAVLIPTFVSIIKKANDSAYVQERQSQRIDDIAQKIDNETWVSWEDMEVKIAEAIAGINKETINKEDVSAAIQKALEEYAAAHQSDNTGLTEAQVQKIVEETTKGNVTLEQVQALIAKIPTGSTGVTTAQVQAIVNQALAGVSASAGLNATQVNNLIKSYLESHPTANAAAIQSAVESALANLKTLSEEDVVEIVNNITSQMSTVTTVLTGVEDNGAGFTAGESDTVIYLMTNRSSTDTYTISGENVKKVVIDAPNMTDVVVACDAEEVVVIRTAMTSVHITGNVTTLEINSGHVEIESDAIVTTVTAAPSTNATVKVTVGGEVTTLNAEYQDHGTGTNDTIIVVDKTNSATVSIVASTELEASGTTTTNVTIESNKEEVVNNSTLPESVVVNVTVETESGETEYVADNTGKVENNENYVAKVGSTGFLSLTAAVNKANENGGTITLLKSVDNQAAIMIYKDIVIEGNGNIITFNGNRGVRVAANDITLTLKNVTLVGGSDFQRAIQVDQNYTNVKLNISGVTATATYYTINFCSGTTVDLVVEKSVITGWAALNFYSDGFTMYVSDSELNGVNDKSKASSNKFATICLEADTTGKTNLYSSNNTVTIVNTKITATQTKGNVQALFAFNYGTQRSCDNVVNVSNCELQYGEGCELYYDNGDRNKLTISESTLNNADYSLNHDGSVLYLRNTDYLILEENGFTNEMFTAYFPGFSLNVVENISDGEDSIYKGKYIVNIDEDTQIHFYVEK